MRRSVVLVITLVCAGLAAVFVVLALQITGPEEPASATPASSPSAVDTRASRETCETRSEADFRRPFSDPGNLVVGPLVLVGGAEFTTPSVVRRVKGQKFPLLVRAGHQVRLAVPKPARAFAGLGYGRLPQGEITLAEAHKVVTFTACPARFGSFSFWSGGVVAHEPHCVPLDVYVDGDPEPQRIVLELGVKPCLPGAL